MSQRAARIRPIADWRAMLFLHSTPGRQLCLNLPEAPWGTTDPVRPYKPADAMSTPIRTSNNGQRPNQGLTMASYFAIGAVPDRTDRGREKLSMHA